MTNPIMTGQGMYQKLSNSDWSGEEVYDGQVGHVGLISAYKVCTDAALTIATITVAKKGYVKGLMMYNTHSVGQTFTLADTVGTVYMTYLNAGECKDIVMETPFLELAAGAVTGDAGTATAIVNVTMTYYEK